MTENENRFEEFETPEDISGLNIDNLIIEIWTKPKKVFSYLFQFEPTKYVNLLLIIVAFTTTLERAISKDTLLNSVSLMFAILFGTLLTWLFYYFYAWILRVVGTHILNGTKKNKDYRVVIAWSSIPAIVSIIPALLASLVYGRQILSENFVPDTTILTVAYFTILALQLICAFWSLTILVIGIMYIQQFNTWKAILNVILPILVLIVLIMLIFMVFVG